MKWINSNRYLKTKVRREEIHRKIKEQRRISHQTIANEIIKMGLDVQVQNVRFKDIQMKDRKNNKKRNIGKPVVLNAPALLVSEIDQKLKYMDHAMNKLDAYSLESTQYNHILDTYDKKN